MSPLATNGIAVVQRHAYVQHCCTDTQHWGDVQQLQACVCIGQCSSALPVECFHNTTLEVTELGTYNLVTV